MKKLLLRLSTAIFFLVAFCLAGCAGMNATFDKIKNNIANLREEKPPITTSIEQMPVDAKAITRAIYKNATMADRDAGMRNVNFANVAVAQFRPYQRILNNFGLAEAHLYEYGDSHIRGTLFLEDALGRRSSLSYDAKYRNVGKTITVDTIELSPDYSRVPESVMFVIPADRFPHNTADLPSTLTGMLELAVSRAVNPMRLETELYDVREYVVLACLLDRISPSAKFDFMVAEESASYGGYKESTQYMDFDGWRIALLSGKFRLVGEPAGSAATRDDTGKSQLYFKAIYTPGKEAGFIRIPKMVGLYCVGGSKGSSH